MKLVTCMILLFVTSTVAYYCYDSKCTGYNGEVIECDQEINECDKGSIYAGPTCTWAGTYDQSRRGRVECFSDSICDTYYSGTAYCLYSDIDDLVNAGMSIVVIVIVVFVVGIVAIIIACCCCCYCLGKCCFSNRRPNQRIVVNNTTQQQPVQYVHVQPGQPASYPQNPPPQGYPPQNPPPQGYPAQGGYPPQQAAYPPQQGSYPPPPQAAYPPAQGGYPPAQGGYPPAQGSQPPPYAAAPPAYGSAPPPLPDSTPAANPYYKG